MTPAERIRAALPGARVDDVAGFAQGIVHVALGASGTSVTTEQAQDPGVDLALTILARLCPRGLRVHRDQTRPEAFAWSSADGSHFDLVRASPPTDYEGVTLAPRLGYSVVSGNDAAEARAIGQAILQAADLVDGWKAAT